jgi:hypothetical protein
VFAKATPQELYQMTCHTDTDTPSTTVADSEGRNMRILVQQFFKGSLMISYIWQPRLFYGCGNSVITMWREIPLKVFYSGYFDTIWKHHVGRSRTGNYMST